MNSLISYFIYYCSCVLTCWLYLVIYQKIQEYAVITSQMVMLQYCHLWLSASERSLLNLKNNLLLPLPPKKFKIQTPTAVHVKAMLFFLYGTSELPSISSGTKDATGNATFMAKIEILESKNAET